MPQIGYILPTREFIMRGRHEATPILELAERAASLGFDSLWVGDSVTARQRQDALTMLAAVAVREPGVTIGTSVLLTALRNPVALAQQIATLDRISEGRLILGFGIGPDTKAVRTEYKALGVPFEQRAGRTLEGLRLMRALWTGEKTDWDGRWQVDGVELAPLPHRTGGPPIVIGGGSPKVRERAGTLFDGWMPVSASAQQWGEGWREVEDHAREAGRDLNDLIAAVVLNLSIDEDEAAADAELDRYIAEYYGVKDPGPLRASHGSYAGTAAGAAEWLNEFAEQGARHFALRFAGDNERHLEVVARVREQLGW